MNVSRIRRVISLTILLVIFYACNTGCSKNAKDNNAADLNGNNDFASNSDANAINNYKSGSSLQYTVQSSNGTKIIVDANIPEMYKEKIDVYAETIIDMSDEYAIQYAKSVFDNGEYEIVKPLMVCNEEELKEVKARLENEALNYNSNEIPERINIEIEQVDSYLENYRSHENTETESDKVLYKFDTILVGSIKGKIDDEEWIMNFECGYQDNKVLMIDIRPYGDHYYWDYDGTCGMEEDSVNNPCDLESSKKLANQTIEKLGFENMAIIDIKHIIPDGGKSSNAAGYYFTYGKSIDGVSAVYSDFINAYIDGMNISSEQEYIRVCINDDGIMSVSYGDSYKTGEVLSQNSSVMGIEEIDNIARSQMVEYIENNSDEDIKITEIAFGYMTVTYDGVGYSLVPVWIYYSSTTDDSIEGKYPLFAINALDGVVIQFENVYIQN